MPFLANPAQRLNWLVQQLMNSPIQTPEGALMTVRQALTAVYGSQESDSQLERLVSTVLALPGDAAAAQRASPMKDDYFLRWYPAVSSAVGKLCNLDHGIDEFQNQLQPQHLESLGAAARLLSSVDTEDDADELEMISMLIEKLNQLADRVSDVGLPEDMERFLLDQIDRMRLALREYRLRGGGGVADATDAAVGAIARAWESYPQKARTDEAQTIFMRVIAFGVKAGGIVVNASTVATAAVALEAASSSLLQIMG